MFLLGRSSVLNDREGIAAVRKEEGNIVPVRDAVRIQGLDFDIL
jgi:hypothetical protein